MKNALIISFALFGLFSLVYGQQPSVPEVVLTAFEQKVSNAQKVSWEYDSGDTLWEVAYRLGKEKFSAEFDEKGQWIETEQDIPYARLPEAVKAALKAEYAAYRVDEVELVESPEGRFYEVELEPKKKNGARELELLLAADGKTIRKEEATEEKE